MYALVLIHIDGIFDIKSIESDGILTYWRSERILEHSDLVVIDIHIGEDVLQHGRHDVASLEEIIDTCGVLTLDNGLFRVRMLTINLL